jgi:hypothetical protein
MPSFTPTELLGAHNYGTWSEEVEAYCMTQQGRDVWLAIDPDTEVPTTNTKLAEWKKANSFAYGTIFHAIHPDHRDVIRDITPAKCGRTAWAALCAHHIKDTPSYRLQLREFFYSLFYSESTGITSYSNALKRVVRDLLDIGYTLSRVEVLDKLLIGLPSAFASIRMTLCGIYDNKEFLLKDAISKLLEFERREGLTPPDQIPSLAPTPIISTAMFASHHVYKDFCWLNTANRSGACFCCGKSGHGAARYVYDMPKEIKEKVLGSATLKTTSGDVFYVEDTPSHARSTSIGLNFGVGSLHTDSIESLSEPQVDVAHIASCSDTLPRSCSRSRSPSSASRGGR